MKNNYSETERKDDFHWFLEQYDSLYKKYGKKFFAIRKKKILGIYDSEIEAINNLLNTYQIGEYIIQECNGDESGYTNYISSWQLISV